MRITVGQEFYLRACFFLMIIFQSLLGADHLEISNLSILNEPDLRQCINHAPEFGWAYQYKLENFLVALQLMHIGTDEDSLIWTFGPAPYSQTRFVFRRMGALVDGEEYTLTVSVTTEDSILLDTKALPFTMNSPPTTPQIQLAAHHVFRTMELTFPLLRSHDGQINPEALQYQFQIYASGNLEIAHIDTIFTATPGSQTLILQPDFDILPDNKEYTACIRAYDGREYSCWSDQISFATNRINEAPASFKLIAPLHNDTLAVDPTLIWEPASDPDEQFGSGLSEYLIEIFEDTSHRPVLSFHNPPNQNQAALLPHGLVNHTRYFWRVIAVDQDLLKTTSEGWGGFTINRGNAAPNPPKLIHPEKGEILLPGDAIIWQLMGDPDETDTVTCELRITSEKNGQLIHSEIIPSDRISHSKSQPLPDLKVSYDNQIRYYLRRIPPGILTDAEYYRIDVLVRDNWGGETLSGWTDATFQYDDNINTAPCSPTKGFYPDSLVITTAYPTLKWDPASDADVADRLRYQIQISQKADFSGRKYIAQKTPYDKTEKIIRIPLLENRKYYWRVRSIDLEEAFSDWSKISFFWINKYNEAPAGPIDLLKPPHLSEADSSTQFWWCPTTDPDPGSEIKYIIEIDPSADFQNPLTNYIVPDQDLISPPPSDHQCPKGAMGIALNRIPGRSALQDNQLYYWRILAIDELGLLSLPPGKTPLIAYNSQNDPPRISGHQYSPLNGEIVSSATPTISWPEASDPDFSDPPESIRYTLELSLSSTLPPDSVRRYSSGRGQNQLTIPEPLTENRHWFYRVRAIDSDSLMSDWSPIHSFIVNAIEEAPLQVTRGFLPKDSMIVDSRAPLISWFQSDDPDPGQTARDLLYLVKYFPAEKPAEYLYARTEAGVTSLELSALDEDTYYGYQVAAVDPAGQQSAWSQTIYFGVNATDLPPQPFLILSPHLYQDSVSVNTPFRWQKAEDTDLGSRIKYTLYLSVDSLFLQDVETMIVYADTADTVSHQAVYPLQKMTKYFWKVAAEDNAGNLTWASYSDQRPFVFTTIGYPKTDQTRRPERYYLQQNYPNPFNLVTTFRYYVPEYSPVEIAIFDVLGKRIRVLASGNHSQGIHEAKWDGTDTEGSPLPGGMYICRMEAKGYLAHKKVLLMK